MNCTACKSGRTEVVLTKWAEQRIKVRRRHCLSCGHRWYTQQPPEVELSQAQFVWCDRSIQILRRAR